MTYKVCHREHAPRPEDQECPVCKFERESVVEKVRTIARGPEPRQTLRRAWPVLKICIRDFFQVSEDEAEADLQGILSRLPMTPAERAEKERQEQQARPDRPGRPEGPQNLERRRLQQQEPTPVRRTGPPAPELLPARPSYQLTTVRHRGRTLDPLTMPHSLGEALAQGEPFYFSRTPCSLGHIAPRFAQDGGSCGACKLGATISYGSYEEGQRIERAYQDRILMRSYEQERAASVSRDGTVGDDDNQYGTQSRD